MATITGERTTAHNNGFKKLVVQWLNEQLCFVSSAVLADSLMHHKSKLRNPSNVNTNADAMKLWKLFFSTLFLAGCFINSRDISKNKTPTKNYWEKENLKVHTCVNKWKYQYLPKKTEIEVLHFSAKFNYDLFSFPNFIIGVTANADTVGIIDLEYNGTINKSEKIIVTKPKESAIYNSARPCFFVSPESKVNDLQCAIKTVYYGQIDSIFR